VNRVEVFFSILSAPGELSLFNGTFLGYPR
jgi:hypothetical protein